MRNQNDTERLQDQLQRGLITADQANVLMVRNERVRVISKLSKDVRAALNKAVKNGDLGHMKKEGKKPEVYYHPEFEYLVNEARSKEENRIMMALSAICA